MSTDTTRLGVMRLGFALGMTSALGMGVLAVLAWCGGWGLDLVALLASVYVGYAPTLTGALIGMAWGFGDGFIAGVVIAFFYNCCCCSKSC